MEDKHEDTSTMTTASLCHRGYSRGPTGEQGVLIFGFHFVSPDTVFILSSLGGELARISERERG